MKTNPDDSINVYDRDKETFSGGPTKGLTKREYFAAMAMQGLLANPEIQKEYEFEGLPEYALTTADALIKELNKDSG